MKKIIGILGVTVIAGVMFFSANNVSGSTSDTNLASLMTLNSANAENSPSGCTATAKCGSYGSVSCTGKRCTAGIGYVTCDGHSSHCAV